LPRTGTAPTPEVIALDEALDPREAAAVVELSRRFREYRPSSYRPVARRPTAARAARSPRAARPALAKLVGRLDTSRNFRRTGGRFGLTDQGPAALAGRSNYFRATFALSGKAAPAAAEQVLHHERLREAARALYGRTVIEPFVVFANVLIPGQELGIHTDIPAFRGVSRQTVPSWLLVVMCHSGLFEDRRIPVATVVLHFGEARGGEFVFYPDGPGGLAATHVPRHNSAVTIDADLIFHGVDRVHGDETGVRRLRSDMRLVHDEVRGWTLRDSERSVAQFASGDVRFSVSWKAYCFTDPAEQAAASTAQSDLSLDAVVERLVAELRARNRLSDGIDALSDVELAHLLIDEFVPFPPPTPSRRTMPRR
jgi:hypothetical protein